MKHSDSYDNESTKICLSAMIELMEILGSYRESIVLVGGWTPYLLERYYQREPNEHIGSRDIDLLIDPCVAESEEYNTILQLLEEAHYKQRIDRDGNPIPFSFEKTFRSANGTEQSVQLDLLTSWENPPTKSKKHRKIQPNLRARKVLGAEIALKHYLEFDLKETLHHYGFETTVKIRVADPVALIVMKGYALSGRFEGKDAYDVYFVISSFKHPRDLALLFHNLLEEEIILVGLKNIRKKFRHNNDSGPGTAALFLGYSEEHERIEIQSRVFTVIDTFLKELNL